MVTFKEDKKTVSLDLLSTFFVIMYLTIIMFVVFTFLTGGGALENPLNSQKFFTYGLLAIASAFIFFISKLQNFLNVFLKLRNQFSKTTNNILDAFDTFIHQPRHSVIQEFSKKKIWWLNAFDLTIIFLIIGMVIGFIQILGATSFAQIFSYLFEQQITKTAEFGLAIEPAVFGETMSYMVFIGIIWGLSKFAVLKGFYSKTTHYFITIGFVPFFSAFIWMLIHLSVYGDFAFGLLVTWGWGYFQALLGMIFVSVIPAYILHATHNGFVKAQSLFATEISALVVSGIITLLLIIFAIRFSLRKR